MRTLLFAAAFGTALAMPALATEPIHDPDHDHRHGARMASAAVRADAPHMTLVEAGRYISAQVPGEIRQIEAYPGASVYHVDMELINGARARFEVNAHDGSVRWHETPAVRD